MVVEGGVLLAAVRVVGGVLAVAILLQTAGLPPPPPLPLHQTRLTDTDTTRDTAAASEATLACHK